jgi:hypothetical protein
MRLVVSVAFALGLAACAAPIAPSTRVSDAARELNLAARFGRMDIALGLTDQNAKSTFVERHAAWGDAIRVLDVELSGLTMPDPHRAWLQVDYSWMRIDESSLRKTRVAQLWHDKNGWQLVREHRVAGDVGLFGERARTKAAPRPDIHLPSRTIRETP